MPTDVLLAMRRRLATRQKEERQEKTAVLLIALIGTAITLLEAAEFDALLAALVALGTIG